MTDLAHGGEGGFRLGRWQNEGRIQWTKANRREGSLVAVEEPPKSCDLPISQVFLNVSAQKLKRKATSKLLEASSTSSKDGLAHAAASICRSLKSNQQGPGPLSYSTPETLPLEAATLSERRADIRSLEARKAQALDTVGVVILC